jgi:hypothetical protein
MIRIFYILFIMFFSESVFGQSQSLSKVDAIVNQAISISEEALFAARFESAKKAVELSYFENLTGYSHRHKALLTLQDIRIDGFMSIVFALETRHQENFVKLKALLPFEKEFEEQELPGQYFRTGIYPFIYLTLAIVLKETHNQFNQLIYNYE